MRKLKLQVQMSIDGFVSGPNGEMDWMTWDWDDALKTFVHNFHQDVDTILLGRKMAAGFMEAWESRAQKEDADWFTHKMVDTPKIVFSKTINRIDGKNVEVNTGDLVTEVNKLKEQDGDDIVVYGGADFVSSLLKNKLIDELNLFVNPATVGLGMPIFGEEAQRLHFDLKVATPYDCGIVVLRYHPAADSEE